MDKFFRIYRPIVLVVNLLIELSVAVIMLVNPAFFVKGPSSAMLAHSFGIGALAIGLLGLLLLFFRNREASIMGFTILAVYHTGIGILQTVDAAPDASPLAAGLFHGWLVVSLIALLVHTYRTKA